MSSETTHDNELRGALFKNDRKENDKHPDYRGELQADGKQYQLSAWIRESQAGRKYLSLALTAKEQQPTTADRRNHDVPF